MIGTLRLFLALVVVLYHAGINPWGLETGVAAVAVFFMVSGFAMTGLAERHFRGGPSAGALGAVTGFYRDRLLRILPQYYVYLAFHVAVLTTLGPSRVFQYGPVDATVVVGYLTVLPLCFFPFSSSLATYMIIPQAWSLGTELCFYAVFPWLLRGRGRVAAWTVLCLGAFVLATHGVFDRDAFTYRILPGPMLFFMLGHFLYRRQVGALGAVLAALAGNALVLALTGGLHTAYNLELHAAAFLGTLAIAGLSRVRAGRLDEAAGGASYGCYLVHFALIFAAEDLHLADALPQTVYAGALAALSVFAGWLSWVGVERPFATLRRALRDRSVPALAGFTPAPESAAGRAAR